MSSVIIRTIRFDGIQIFNSTFFQIIVKKTTTNIEKKNKNMTSIHRIFVISQTFGVNLLHKRRSSVRLDPRDFTGDSVSQL